MRVGFVLDESFDPTDGVQQYMQTVGTWLSTHGHDVYYLVGQTARTDVAGIHSLSRNIRVKFNGNWLSMPLPVAGKKLQQVLDDLHLDILHVQTPYSPLMAGKLIRRVPPHCAVVGTFHIMPYGRLARFGSNILGKINTKTAKRFDAMMAVSVPAQVFAGEHFGFQSSVVPNPFSHDVFSAARRGRKKPHKKLRIVFLGRLVPRKGPKQLLVALDCVVRNRLTDHTFEVILGGKGPQYDSLKHFVANSELKDIVSMPGFVAEADKPALLASADIAVFPSTSGESFGISLLEAMAACRGVVLAGNNPGYASVVANKKQLIEPNDAESFATHLAYWLDHSAERKTIAKTQQRHAQEFDIDVIGPKIVAVYKQALQKRRST